MNPDATVGNVTRVSVGLTTVACALLLVGFWAPGAELWAAVGCGLLPVALVMLGLASAWGRVGAGMRGVVIGVLVAMALGPWAVYRMTMRWGAEDGEWWLGLPAPTALLVFGVGLASLVVTGWVYAGTFGEAGVREEDLERLAQLRAEETKR